MPQTINTNVVSLNAQRNLNMSQSSLSVSMQRLSSGLRVNSAKDDAAGLAIAERMNTQVRGLNVAARNANDGISLAQTAEGALGKIGDMLQRMRELAVQAGNATNSVADRKALQAEVAQLREEIDRVAKQTSFNGQRLLDGSFTAATFQIGANSGDGITVGSLVNSTAAAMSEITYSTGSNLSVAVTEADMPRAGLGEIASGLTITVGTGGSATTIDIGPISEASNGKERIGQIVEAINRKTLDTGVTAYLTQNADGTITIEYMAGRLDGSTPAAPQPVVFSGTFTAATTGVSPPTISTASVADSTGIDDLSVETESGIWVSIKKIDNALDEVNSGRATLGALQSRFESAVSNIQIQAENLSAARGRIMDADFATETANLSRAQILQQAGTAMVAQANQLPQQVLQLLK